MGPIWPCQVVVRDGIYVREEVLMLIVRLPTAGLQVSTEQTTAVAYAFQEQEMKSLGCWDAAEWGRFFGLFFVLPSGKLT